MPGQLIAIDLYCGCGGLTQGLRDIGFMVAAAVEIDPDACETYALNHPTTTLIKKDIRKISPRELCRRAGVKPEDVTLLAACAPCQFFSRQNRIHKNDETALVKRFVVFARYIRPPLLLMENVPELARGRGQKAFFYVVQELESLGYHLWTGILDAADYGVAQHRRRLIMVGAKDRRIIDLMEAPRPALGQKTVRMAIGHLPPIEPGGPFSPDNLHCASPLSPINIERLKHIPADGGDRRSLPERLILRCHRKVSGYTDTYGRLWWQQPARTITTGFLSITKGRYGHPEQNRGLSLLEGALLQGFPESYRFRGTPTSIARQIGNAVPPPFISSLLRPLLPVLSDSENGGDC